MINPADSFLAVDSDGAMRPQIGHTAAGAAVFAPFRPTPLSLANTLNQVAAAGADAMRHIPLPTGMMFTHAANTQLQLVLTEPYARRHKRVFGYVGEIQLSGAGFGTSPFPCLFPSSRVAMVNCHLFGIPLAPRFLFSSPFFPYSSMNAALFNAHTAANRRYDSLEFRRRFSWASRQLRFRKNPSFRQKS